MAEKDRMAVLAAMMEQSMIPVFYHPDVEVCSNVIQACANGGAKCVEFTNRGDFAAHVFYEVTRHFAKADPSVIMGVGSIVDAPTAGIYIANGAKFVVGPLLNVEVAKTLQPSRHPLQPRLRLRHRNRRRAGTRLRNHQGLPGCLAWAARSSSRASWARCPGPASCPPAASNRPKNPCANGSAPASSPAASAPT